MNGRRSLRGRVEARHRAKTGCVNVLSGALYGYRYVRKSDTAEAYYAVIEAEAEVVREVFELYIKELWSIGTIGMATCFGVDLAHEVRKRERTDFLPS
jgi:hypothetical protein